MKIINIQKKFVSDMSKELIELPKSPIGKIDCPLNTLLSKINKFKKTAIPLKYTHDKYVSSKGEQIISSEYIDKNKFRLFWNKFFIISPKKKLVQEDFIDAVNKTTIKYSPVTGKMESLQASSPRGTIKYMFA